MDYLQNIKLFQKPVYFCSSPCSKHSIQSEDDRETALSSDLTPKPKVKPLKSMSSGSSPFDNDDYDRNCQREETRHKTCIPKLSRFSTQKIITVNEGDQDEEPEIIDKEFNQSALYTMTEDQSKDIVEKLKIIEERIKVNPKLNSIKSKPISMRNFQQVGESKQDNLIDHPFRHLVFSPKISEEKFEKHLNITQRGLIYSKKCLKGPSEQFIEKKKIELPRLNPNKLKTLFLDLDETLVHASSGRDIPQIKLIQQNDDGSVCQIGINIRPYTTYFLSEASQYFTIYIYTASSQQYAESIVNYLDPKKQYISGILHRNNCMETKNGFFIKDLRIISNLDLDKTLIVDNLVHSFGLQISNGIPIIEWKDDLEDLELKYLLEYLVDASESENLREFNVNNLQLEKLQDFIIKQ